MTSTVASAIRPGLRDARQAPGSPHTPSRYISSVQSSPGSSFFRAEEDPIIVHLDPRRLSAGFQGESGPQCTIPFTPQNSTRIGDYRTLLPGYKRKREDIQARSKEYELWRSDVRDVDMGLLEDKLERAVREAYNQHLLVDAGVARLVLVLPSLVPHPVLSTVLKLLFERWKYSTITLLPTPAMTVAAAGLRSGIIVEVGWEETVITAIYEYREVQVRRSVCAMRALTGKIAELLQSIRQEQDESVRNSLLLDFDFVEEFIDRVGACHGMVDMPEKDLAARTQTLEIGNEQTTQTADEHTISTAKIVIEWPTDTASRPVAISRAALHHACFETLVGSTDQNLPDDHEQSIGQLLYRTLLSLSPDVRNICLPRVIFSGPGSNVAGLAQCILATTQSIVDQHGWAAVRGRHFSSGRSGLSELTQGRAAPADARHDVNLPGAKDFIEERLYKEKLKDAPATLAPTLRQVGSLGPWAGASLVASLKAKSFVEIERERFLSQGLAGAHRDMDNNVVPHRMTAAKGSERTGWTLAGWG